MEIKLNLPDWTDERGLHILAGIEEVARRMPPDFKWAVKTERCNMCGKCCGDCEHLEVEGDHFICDLGVKRPYICCVSEGEPGECNIRWTTK